MESAKRPITITIGWTDPGQVMSKFSGAISRLLLNSNGRIDNVIASSGPYLSYNRNMVVRQFLETESQWLLILDSDVIISPKDLFTLCESADEINRPIVSGKYFLAWYGDNVHLAARKNNKWLDDYKDNTIYDGLDNVGGGYILIHRKVFEAVAYLNPEHPFPWFQDEWNGVEWLSDDVYFFNQCNQLGINIAINTGAASQHMKQFGVTDSTAVRVNKINKKISKWAAVSARSSWWRVWKDI